MHEIPLERLVGPAVVIDMTAAAQRDRDDRLTREDVVAFEREHGRIAPGTIVRLRAGSSQFWPSIGAPVPTDRP